jgi:hypothetical protein
MKKQDELEQEEVKGGTTQGTMAKSNNMQADNTIKNPDDWSTGEEPMTGAQNSYLHTLASEAGETIEGEMTKAEASKKIEELQQKTGRGIGQDNK